ILLARTWILISMRKRLPWKTATTQHRAALPLLTATEVPWWLLICNAERHESNAVAKVFQELENRGMMIDHYSASDEPIFELIEGEGDRTTVTPLFSIPKILDAIKEIGRRGVQIKRFKGLGEMNAKELFSTTMDPLHRKLLRVDLNENNAGEADKMFTILMGDVVEPRRAFIEDNALNVRNLDV